MNRIFFFFPADRAPVVHTWPQICYGAQDDFEFIILPSSKRCDYSFESPTALPALSCLQNAGNSIQGFVHAKEKV